MLSMKEAFEHWMGHPLVGARPSTLVRSRAGRLFSGGVALATLLTFCVLAIQPAQADPSVTPSSGHFTIKGAGYGHGYGMSQYGAYGAARKGLAWKQILAFYYRGTKLTTLADGTTIRARISADTDGSLRVRPVSYTHLTLPTNREV